MIPTHEQREERYKTLSPQQKALYASEEIGAELREVFNEFHLKEETYRKYALVFGDVVLGFLNREDMQNALIERLGIGPRLAIPLTQELHKLLEKQITPLQEESEGPEDSEETNVPPQPSRELKESNREARENLDRLAETYQREQSQSSQMAPNTPAEVAARHSEKPVEPPSWRQAAPPENDDDLLANEPGLAPGTKSAQHEDEQPLYPKPKPVTQAPRYDFDPYREPPRET